LRAREAMADWLGGNADEIAFGPSMTALTFQLSRVLSRCWATGDNVVVTEQDHHANVDTRLRPVLRGSAQCFGERLQSVPSPVVHS
jgi:selenocysteine lyase/cysteine desulfurase